MPKIPNKLALLLAAGSCCFAVSACSVKSNPNLLTCANLPRGVLGAPYEFDLTTITVEDAAFSEWSADNLPLGLSLDPDTGVLSGIPLAGLPDGLETTFYATVEGREFSFSNCSNPFACASLPVAAIGYEYSVELASLLGAEGAGYRDWTASNLPAGMTLDTDNGVLYGIPELASDGEEIALQTSDGETTLSFCAEFRVIEQPISSLGIRDQDPPCLPPTTSKAELVELLTGSSTSPITCHAPALNIPDVGEPTCIHGEGNGKMAPGLAFDEASCAHSGEIDTDTRGTWVWTIEVEQEGFSTWVPFCATNDVATEHALSLTLDSDDRDDLEPILYEFNPMDPLSFPAGYEWTLEDPDCDGSCEGLAFEWVVQCSPFAPSFEIDEPTDPAVFTYSIAADGPEPDDEFHRRPFVTSFDFSYCTSPLSTDCDPATDAAKQTSYHVALIAYPE